MTARLFCPVALALALAGCGGSDTVTGIDKGLLEEKIATTTDLNLVAEGGGTSTVSCVEDSDAWHFTCYVKIAGGDFDGESYTLQATCDESGDGTCIWRPS